jgi:hypothetical protein
LQFKGLYSGHSGCFSDIDHIFPSSIGFRLKNGLLFHNKNIKNINIINFHILQGIMYIRQKMKYFDLRKKESARSPVFRTSVSLENREMLNAEYNIFSQRLSKAIKGNRFDN